MDPSNAQHHHQEMSSQTLESMLVCTKPQQDKKPRPPSSEQALKCPRCDSTNTKFCYYNNYSLTQPRYFCKSCRRYWTKGGTLRNVPVGGGCRKNKRSSCSSSSSAKRSQENQSMINSPNPLVMSSLTPLSYDSSDLSLAFARLHQKQTSGHFGSIEDHHHHDMSMMCANNVGNSDVLETPNGFLDALRGGFLETTPNGFHHNNLYYGINGNVENGGMGMNASDQQMQGMHSYDQELSSGVTTPVTTTTTTTAVKQEMCSLARENENRILWGFPWQMNGDVVNNGDFESSNRQSWNGLGGSSWHGLLNSPLM